MGDAVAYIVIFLLVLLFVGEPDIHDVLILWLMGG